MDRLPASGFRSGRGHESFAFESFAFESFAFESFAFESFAFESFAFESFAFESFAFVVACHLLRDSWPRPLRSHD